MLRIRVPEGWKVVGAKTGTRRFEVDQKGTADISELKGKHLLEFQVAPTK